MRRTPDAVAVVHEATRAHLRRARRAGQPAGAPAHRRGRGAGDDSSPCCVERSARLVVALLGILKAGARLRAARPALPAASGWPACSRTAAPRCCSRDRERARSAAATVPIDAGVDEGRASDTRRDLARPQRPAAPRLCDLHLGLDRPAEGGRDRRTGRWPRGLARGYAPLRAGDRVAFAANPASTRHPGIWAALLNGGAAWSSPPTAPSMRSASRRLLQRYRSHHAVPDHRAVRSVRATPFRRRCRGSAAAVGASADVRRSVPAVLAERRVSGCSTMLRPHRDHDVRDHL